MTEYSPRAEMTWKCSVCQGPLLEVPSGSICPEGHGNILPKMPAKVRQYNHALIMGIQVARNVMGRISLGDGTTIELDRKVSRQLKDGDLKNHVALDGGIWRIKGSLPPRFWGPVDE